jgi:hypothetical protein
VITPKQCLLILLKKKNVTLDYARTNDFHVMWNRGVIHIRDNSDLVNVIFQSRHLNRIIARFEMFGPFKELH